MNKNKPDKDRCLPTDRNRFYCIIAIYCFKGTK